MPELPEVEAARKLVNEHCLNRTIIEAIVGDDDKVIDGVTPKELSNALQGRKIIEAKRKGKHLWFELDNDGPCPLFHFGMTGNIAVLGKGRMKYRSSKEPETDDWPPPFCKVQLNFEGGTSAAFCDARRFGRVRLQTDPLSQEPLSKLGFDTLTEMPSREAFEERLRQHSRPSTRIKALLLDQAFSAGVGNWIADEVLYQARIHPEHPVAALTPAHLDTLHEALERVVRVAVSVDADSDNLPPDWLFHYRWTNKKASSIGGKTIAFITAGGRTSAYVPELQKLPPGNRSNASKAGKAGTKRKKAAAEDTEPDAAEADPEDAASSPPAKKRRRTASAARTGAGGGGKQKPAGRGRAATAAAGKEEPAGNGKAATAVEVKKEPAGKGKAATAIEVKKEPAGKGKAATATAVKKEPAGKGKAATATAVKEPAGKGRAATAAAVKKEPAGKGKAATAAAVKKEPVARKAAAATDVNKDPTGSNAATAAAVKKEPAASRKKGGAASPSRGAEAGRLGSRAARAGREQ